jgi:hypothetical protein
LCLTFEDGVVLTPRCISSNREKCWGPTMREWFEKMSLYIDPMRILVGPRVFIEKDEWRVRPRIHRLALSFIMALRPGEGGGVRLLPAGRDRNVSSPVLPPVRDESSLISNKAGQ